MKKSHKKIGMSLSLPVFALKSHPWCHVSFVKIERLECEVKLFLG